MENHKGYPLFRATPGCTEAFNAMRPFILKSIIVILQKKFDDAKLQPSQLPVFTFFSVHFINLAESHSHHPTHKARTFLYEP